MTPTKAGAQGARPLPQTRPDELIRQCLSTLASEPKDVSSLVGLMQACLSLGAWDEVAYTARRLLAVAPTHPEAQAHLAMLQALEGDAKAVERLKMRNQAFARAREVLQRVLAEYPDHADTHLNLAIALARIAREPAQRHTEKALELGTPEVQEQASRLLTKLRASA